MPINSVISNGFILDRQKGQEIRISISEEVMGVSMLLRKEKVREALIGIMLLLGAAALLRFPQESIKAAKDGLALCGNVIIPSLFPFFILSSMVVELGLAGHLGRALEGLMRPLFRVSGACVSAVVLGFIGGYPVGARTAISLYENGYCTKTEAERLLAFCNNSGPAFILGVVGAGIFTSGKIGVILYLIHALSSLFVGLIFRHYGRNKEKEEKKRMKPRFETKRFSQALTDSVGGALNSMLNICAFVVFFTVVIRMLFRSGFLPALARLIGAIFGPLGFSQIWAERLLTGAIEISSGVWTLAGSGALAGRLSMAAFMLGWAGVSVHCQVLTFLGNSGLSARTYFLGKLIHGALAALLTAVFFYFFPLKVPASAYLVEQVEGIAQMQFGSALTISVACAWTTGVGFVLATYLALRKTAGRRRRYHV